MGKPKMFGMNTPYTPNAKRDMRFRKKSYQRPREIAQRIQVAGQTLKAKEETNATRRKGNL